MTLRDRHLVGAGAAACAVCCAAPVLGLFGLATVGTAATMATLLFAGTVFALVVGVAMLAGVLLRRRAQRAAVVSGATCAVPSAGPVHVDLTASPDSR
ncbi:hypothetical protein SAMN05192575_109128 [Nocardioides alpinus]|uniref:Mercuric ion transport protein n=1 Tax=Nocardioides alpinus TaxID=748909 RepID=A0A1I1AK17_9ACTN|nr:hypothetical protein [Nocardioides alpinus]PKH41744.1 hypothetical protein CXG46_07655 [Nocardioides alpinus]SFB38375.1 hypothetical protein SAMN05192575_109128 [Nocardioides alpinus]